jgi:hypothetical protein
VVGYGIPKYLGLLLVAAWALLPATYETWASATNLQWVCSVSMLMVLALPTGDIERNPMKAALWTVLCGLTGVTSAMLGPAFLLRGWLDRSRAYFTLGILLCACALLQLFIVKTLGVTQREFTLGLRLSTLPSVLQTVFSPLIGVTLVEQLARPMRNGGVSLIYFLAVYVAAFALIGFSLIAAYKARGAHLVLTIASTWLLVTFLNTFGALGPALSYVSASYGARYFLFGSMCFCLLLSFGTTARNPMIRYGSVTLLAMICITAVIDRARGDWFLPFVTGPSWRNEIKTCRPDKACTVNIWPQGWSVVLAPHQ